MYTSPMTYTVQLMGPRYCPHTDAILGEQVVMTAQYQPVSLSGAKFIARRWEKEMIENGDLGEFRIVVKDSNGNNVFWWEPVEMPVPSVQGTIEELVNDCPF